LKKKKKTIEKWVGNWRYRREESKHKEALETSLYHQRNRHFVAGLAAPQEEYAHTHTHTYNGRVYSGKIRSRREWGLDKNNFPLALNNN
jgi:hypothetical protein